MLVIKAGGSAITHKKMAYKANEPAMRTLAKQLTQIDEPVILVHGVGSYGHPPAKKYRIGLGADGTHQRRYGLAVTHFWAGDLAQKLIGILIDTQISAVQCRASSLFITQQRRIVDFFREPVQGYLDLGFIPVMHGDGPIDRNQGFSVLSGDQIAIYLAKQFKARKVIFAMDVPGILKNNQVIENLPYGKIQSIRQFIIDNQDASGGLASKLLEIETLAPSGIPVQLVTLHNDSDLLAAVHNKPVGTLIS